MFVNAGYTDDEVNSMLDSYGYKSGGYVPRVPKNVDTESEEYIMDNEESQDFRWKISN